MIRLTPQRSSQQGGHRAAELQQHCRNVLRRLSWPYGNGQPALRTLGVTSCLAGEGVTTVAAQLAAAAASFDQQRVLLVDANLARPMLSRKLGVARDAGLADLLAGRVELADVVHDASNGTHVLPAGQTPPDGGDVFDCPGLPDAARAIGEQFDLAVVDLPAAEPESPALQLAPLLNGVLLVVESERVRCDQARRTTALLARCDVHLVGAVLNKRKHRGPAWLDPRR